MPYLTLLTGLFSKVPKQILMYAMASIILVFAYKYIKHSIYQDGYGAAVIEMELKYKTSLESSIEAYRQRSAEAIALEQEKAKIASEALQKLREAPKEIEVKEIVKIVENGDCKSLSDDYLGVLNSQYGEDPFK